MTWKQKEFIRSLLADYGVQQAYEDGILTGFQALKHMRDGSIAEPKEYREPDGVLRHGIPAFSSVAASTLIDKLKKGMS